MNDSQIKQLMRGAIESAPVARFDLDAAMRSGRRRHRIRTLTVVASTAAVVAVVGGLVWTQSPGAVAPPTAVAASSTGASTSGTSTNTIVPTAPLPLGALGPTDSAAFGVAYKVNPGKPVLTIWEDFQCPICKQLETTTVGSTLTRLADQGKITLIRRPTTFLDQRPEAQGGRNPDSSARATAAWGCALDAGKGEAFHRLLFANQPDTEFTGWSDAELIDLGRQAGISADGLTTFESCYRARTYDQWVANSYATFVHDGVPGTPIAFLNNVEVPSGTLQDPATLESFITHNSTN
jgi:protein-disulfide isomerase